MLIVTVHYSCTIHPNKTEIAIIESIIAPPPPKKKQKTMHPFINVSSIPVQKGLQNCSPNYSWVDGKQIIQS